MHTHLFSISQQRAAALTLTLGCTLVLCAVLPSGRAIAAGTSVAQDTDMRDDRYVDAKTVLRLKQGTRVDILKTEAGWILIQSGKKTGWVRANMLTGDGATVAPAAKVESGRTASGNIVATSSIRSLPRTTRHALLVGIGNHGDPATPALTGVVQDMRAARDMAIAMSVPESNIRSISDADASKEKLEKELADLANRSHNGDRIFLYFSGTGTQIHKTANATNATNAATGPCSDALLAGNNKTISNQELATWIKPLTDKADKVFVFYDVGHAGMDGSSAPDKKSKFLTTQTGAACASSTSTDDFMTLVQQQGALAQNLVYVASSRKNEASYIDDAKGSVATRLWRDCMLGDARDLDNSGAISIEEIGLCTQQKINVASHATPVSQIQHLLISGNKALVPGWSAGNASKTTTTTANNDASASIALPSLPGLPPLPAINPASTVITQSAAIAALSDILAQADARRKVTISLAQNTLAIGQDALRFSISSSHDGYVYIVLLGSDGQSFYMLFPNDLDGRNYIKAGQTLELPHQEWEITAQGPAGTDKMLVVVTDTPRRLSNIGNTKNGPFLQTLTDSEGRSNLQWLLGTSMNQTASQCRADARKNTSTGSMNCSDAFGASQIDIIEK